MQIWQDLIKYSLIGSERQTAPLSAEGDLQAYVGQLYPDGAVPGGEAREQALLGAAALAAQYRLAGRQAARFDGALPPADCAAPLPVLPPLAVNHLQRLLDDSTLKALLPEWLELAAAGQRRVPFGLIPPLLELAAQNRALRPAITVLIDQRGLWLAKQHADWQRVVLQSGEALGDIQVWEEGSPAQREAYLRQARRYDAAQARELLQAVWAQEPAANRQTLLAAMHEQLGPGDEAFLNTCLADRSKGVRQSAAVLLGQLPDSAFSRRQKQRASAWLRLEKSGGLFKKTTVQVALPEHWDRSWAGDALEEKPPQGKGQKAWWLEQVLSTIPPSYWCEHWQIPALELLALLDKHDWRDTLITGWRQALQNYPDADWAEALLWTADLKQPDLWKMLPPPQAERLAGRVLGAVGDKELGNALGLLTYLQHSWSREFSILAIDKLQRCVKKTPASSGVHFHYWPELARYLAPECCDLLIEKLTIGRDTDLSGNVVDRMLLILVFRRDMRAALQSVPQS